MFSTIDRRERTVYVTGMHASVTEETIYDLLQQAGPIEKVILHETETGEPHHALVVFKMVESVMFSISLFNGYRLLDLALALRPLRESSHAAVLQKAMSSQRAAPPLSATAANRGNLAPPPPPTTPTALGVIGSPPPGASRAFFPRAGFN